MDAEENFVDQSEETVVDQEENQDSQRVDWDYIQQLIAEEENSDENPEKFEDFEYDDNIRVVREPFGGGFRGNSVFCHLHAAYLHFVQIVVDLVSSDRIMIRATTFLSVFIVITYIYGIVMESMSKPTILKAKQSRPFFPNSSSKYLTDYYAGNMKPDDLLVNTDLLILMYYSPWSTHSVHMRHPFEIVAKFMNHPKKVCFAAINCWAPGSVCRSSYKLMNYPVIAAYSGTVSVMYTGPATADSLYRWVVRLQNPVIAVNTQEELQKVQLLFKTVLLSYFPFKNMIASSDYKSYAAAAFLLASGTQQDDNVVACVVTSMDFARHIGFRFEGDLKLIRGNDMRTSWAIGKRMNALNILDFVRKQATFPGKVHFATKTHDLSSTTQLSTLLNKSPVLFLVTPLEPMYGKQDEVIMFSQLAQDYWKCDEKEKLLRPKENVIIQPPRFSRISRDQQECEALNMDLTMHDDCCRSLVPSINWNEACASGTKYRWEEEEASHKTRNHWTEAVLPLNQECTPLRVMPANQLVQSCCDVYDKITTPYLNEAQRILEHDRLNATHEKILRHCLRYKLAEYFSYNLTSAYSPFIENISDPFTVQGLGCNRNDSLQFAVINSNTEKFFLDKWGLTDAKTPLTLIVDTSKELFVTMKEDIHQSSLQRFIHDFHGNLLNDYMLDEKKSQQRFNQKVEDLEEQNDRVLSQETISRLSRSSFLNIAANENSTIDQLVFFSGGGWHGPSTSVLFEMHTLAQYFDRTKDLIKFYTIDVTKNELPYNFNFESIPSIVLFLAGRRDVSWKYPEMLPITAPNLISFIVSRCSPQLRWKTSLLNCNDICLLRNIRKLRRKAEKLQRELRTSVYFSQEHPEKVSKWKHKISQLTAMRSVLRTIASNSHETGLNEIVVDRLLKSEHMSSLFSTL